MDFRAVGAGALWIVGFGVILAALSYISWWNSAQASPPGLRRAWRRPQFVSAFDGGLGLVCAGFALAGREWWEQALWLLLALLFTIQGLYPWWQIWQASRAGLPGESERPVR
ncbi:MAG: hypothetical protein KKA73_09185 [Chloroflexi bacterium]|nr:hypothetical protein [Chloroflexota bacterium]MBU1879120.1 hypothetical protein [Chloroflexota bacterium]